MNMQPAAINMNAGVNANAAVSQALQASAPSMLSLFTPEGESGKGSDIANIAASPIIFFAFSRKPVGQQETQRPYSIWRDQRY